MTKQRLEIKEGYEALADAYDELTLAITRDERVQDEYLPDVRGRAVVELGCGTGRKLVKLRAMGAGTVTGVDFSPRMLAVAAQKLGQRAVLIEHDISRPLPFADHGFDVALFTLVIEHVADLASLFRETRRILAPAGKMVLATIHPRFLQNGRKIEFQVKERGLDFCGDGFYRTADDIEACAAREAFACAGFQVWGQQGLLTATFTKA